jgi:ketosteroid isomerase-like protein
MSTSDRDFATEWVQAWNSHDLERVLSHYDDTVTLISPRAQLVLGIADGAVRGKAALRDYIKRALENVPDLSFTLERVFSGVNSVVIEFHTSDGRHGAELMDFAKNGRVARVIAHYASE